MALVGTIFAALSERLPCSARYLNKLRNGKKPQKAMLETVFVAVLDGGSRMRVHLFHGNASYVL